MIPEFWCYKRIPKGISTTNLAEDKFMWGDEFVGKLVDKVGWGGGIALGTRHRMEDGCVELRSGSQKVLDAASAVLRDAGYAPQRERHS